jgi:hypothetical protein
MHMGQLFIRSSRFWQQALVVGIHLLLLAPVPVFAALTLGTWSQVKPDGTPGGPTPWSTNSSAGLDLALSPVAGADPSGTVEFDFVAPVTTIANNVDVNTSGFSAFAVSSFSQNKGLIVTVGFSTSISPANLNRTIFVSNQFNTGQIMPDSLTGTHTPQNATALTDYAVVKFVFTNPSTWAPVISTPVHITFTGGS